MEEEASDLCVAASETVGNAMTVATYHVITNPEIYANLRKELIEAFPDPSAEIGFAALEKLPYLTGVIREGQR